jgi:hypothetical protein
MSADDLRHQSSLEENALSPSLYKASSDVSHDVFAGNIRNSITANNENSLLETEVDSLIKDVINTRVNAVHSDIIIAHQTSIKEIEIETFLPLNQIYTDKIECHIADDEINSQRKLSESVFGSENQSSTYDTEKAENDVLESSHEYFDESANIIGEFGESESYSILNQDQSTEMISLAEATTMHNGPIPLSFSLNLRRQIETASVSSLETYFSYISQNQQINRRLSTECLKQTKEQDATDSQNESKRDDFKLRDSKNKALLHDANYQPQAPRAPAVAMQSARRIAPNPSFKKHTSTESKIKAVQERGGFGIGGVK